MHQELQKKQIFCRFDDVCVPTCIPVRSVKQVNRRLAVSHDVRGISNIMILNLIKTKDLPPSGKQLGNFLNVAPDSGKDDDGQDFNHLVVKVELDAIDKAGKKYQLEKRYNLDGRGLGLFRNDYKSWSGRKLKDQDLVAFDADTLMKGQRATVVVKARKDGKEFIAVIDTFLPVPVAGVPSAG